LKAVNAVPATSSPMSVVAMAISTSFFLIGSR